jgi:hypothetical protein
MLHRCSLNLQCHRDKGAAMSAAGAYPSCEDENPIDLHTQRASRRRRCPDIVDILLMDVVVECRPETGMDRGVLVAVRQFLIGTEKPVCPWLNGTSKPCLRAS